MSAATINGRCRVHLQKTYGSSSSQEDYTRNCEYGQRINVYPFGGAPLMGQRQRPRPERLAPKLRQLRCLLGLTQEQMAECLAHIESPPQAGHVSEFEGGRREPSLMYL